MDITVRRLRQGDESTLVDIMRRHKARSIGVEHATRILANPLNFLLVAEHQQHSVGFVLGCLLQRLDRDKHQLFVYGFTRRKKARRRSLANELYCCQEHHLMEAFVLADSDNLAAYGLYKSNGATKVEGLSAMFLYGGGTP